MILTRTKEIGIIINYKIDNIELIKIIINLVKKLEFNNAKKMYYYRYYSLPLNIRNKMLCKELSKYINIPYNYMNYKCRWWYHLEDYHLTDFSLYHVNNYKRLIYYRTMENDIIKKQFNDSKIAVFNKIGNYPKHIGDANKMEIDINRFILKISIKTLQNGFIDYYENNIPKYENFDYDMNYKIKWINKKIKNIFESSWNYHNLNTSNNYIPGYLKSNKIIWPDDTVSYYSLFDDITNDLITFKKN